MDQAVGPRSQVPSRSCWAKPSQPSLSFRPINLLTHFLFLFLFLLKPCTRGPHVILSRETDWWTPLTVDPADLAVDPMTVDLVNVDQVNADVSIC
jgi:hypothetical protein